MKSVGASQMWDVIIIRRRWHDTSLCVALECKLAGGEDWSKAFLPPPGHLGKHTVCRTNPCWLIVWVQPKRLSSSLHWMHSSSLRKGLTSGVPAGGKTTHPSRQFPYSHETLFALAVLTGFPFCFLLTFLSFPYEVNKYFKKKESCVALLFCLIYILEPKDSIFSPKQSCWPSSKNAFL